MNTTTVNDPDDVTDKSEAFLDSLPELKDGETFIFDCNEKVPCFNRCCAELTLPLTPYDVLRLRRHLSVDSETLLQTHTQMRSFPDTGFPLPLLKMQSGPGEPCPFVTPGGCSIYEDRPGACRAYPLGRGTKLGANNTKNTAHAHPDRATDALEEPSTKVVERFFLVREDHCCGFDTGTKRTAKEWLKDQELEDYNVSNDRYMRIMAMVKASGQPISSKLATMCILAFYQLDKFREFLNTVGVLDKVDISPQRRAAVLAEDEACLDFAFDWIELVVFGQCPTLQRKS